jgi:hypothetical protein
MADQPTSHLDLDSVVYQIRVKGHLSCEWSDWFDGLLLVHEDSGETLLSGPMDQATLYGVLKKVRDLGLPLLAVNPLKN